MGLAQDFRDSFDGIQFFLVNESKGVGKFRSDFIVIPEIDNEVFFEVIVSLKDNFYLPQTVLIQDVYNSAEKVHNISQFQNVPVKTHILYDSTHHEKTF